MKIKSDVKSLIEDTEKDLELYGREVEATNMGNLLILPYSMDFKAAELEESFEELRKKYEEYDKLSNEKIEKLRKINKDLKDRYSERLWE